jgi:transmembrane sensor
MLDKEFRISRLIKDHMNNELDERSSEELHAWLEEHPTNKEYYNTLNDPENLRRELNAFESVKTEELWQITQSKVAESKLLDDNIRSIKKYSWLSARVAAAAAIFIVAVGLWIYKETSRDEIKPISYANDLSPGRLGATLTLANGKKIRLDAAKDGDLATEAGVKIAKTRNGQLIYTIEGTTKDNQTNTLSTNNGETYQVQLPDGSHVWLNAGSSLSYNSNLIKNGIRSVQLTGEGYFEVAKDKFHPFKVQSGDHDVEVLGTHFNINCYKNEPAITTTLLEGSVKVSFKSAKQLLKPGHQSKLYAAGNFTVAAVDPSSFVAWKDRQFNFESEDIQTIMRMVERWYGVKVEYRGSISEEKFWGGVSRLDNVSKILNVLELTGKVHFDIKGKTIYVYKDRR